MKKIIFFILTTLLVCINASPIHANALKDDSVTPFSTVYGNGGVSKIEIHDNRTRAWWYALPYTNGPYQFLGEVNITFSNGQTMYYPVSGRGNARQSVSGSIDVKHLRKKIKKVTFSGTAYGTNGIHVVIPQSDTVNYGGGITGMRTPTDYAID